jgi:predicted hotdog family 3-hydroxylacyl-ACP dehydratase
MTIDYQQPDEAFLRAIDIHELLPQQEPFVMVSRLVHFDDVRTICEMNIQADNIFVEDGHFNALGMIENIAQTCAARIGYVNKFILKKAVQIGFIGAIRNLEVTDLPEVGQQITTIVDVIEEVFGMTLASAVIKQGNRTLATTEMKIAVKEQ